MKAKFLKLAGVKNEKEFYKKFPTEDAFMAKYGKQLKKAATGISLMPVNAPKLPTLNNTFASVPKPSLGSTTKSYASNIGKGLSNITKPDMSIASGVAGAIGGISAGINTIKQTDKNIAELQKYGKVSDVVAIAASSRPQQQQHRYVRPEDNLVQNINPLGSGTNYLQAENGAEIQNTYAPDVMYTDLGYEPLNDSNKVKAFKKGGKLKKAFAGAMLDAANAAADISRQAGQLGGGLGSQWGGAGGETGGYTQALGGFGLLGGLAGGLLDAPQIKKRQQAQSYLDNNIGLISGGEQFNKFTQQNSGVMEDGGWVSNDWQPQVIASFGDHSVKDLLAPDPMMDTLRAGGHLKYYTPPSERAMSTERAEDGAQMAMGGDLQVHRGEAETMSYNPFLPNGGETVMFRGPSHDNGGMPISYGENGVEVEGGEPAQVMKDGGKQDNLVVFGNMHIPDYGANEIGDPKAKGMKFKRYIADLSKKEAKNNKTMDKSLDLINNSNTDDPFDQLSFNSGQAMLTGSKMQLKSLAEKKMNTAAVQNAILETAEEHGLDSSKLADKQIAAFGGKFAYNDMFAKGGKTSKTNLITAPSKPIDTLESFVKNLPFNERKSMATSMGIKDFTGSADQNQFLLNKTQQSEAAPITPIRTPGYAISNSLLPQTAMNKSIASGDFGNNSDNINNEESAFDLGTIAQTALGSVYPFIRPSAAMSLDPNQLAPEMLATSMNQLEPVQAQQYNPMLTQATSISLQDQLNEITSQARAAEKMAPYNPAAASAIFGQAAQAKTKVLGEQFRMNQAEKQRVSEQNISVLNDAQLKNLALLDQQYVRQSESKSKTKAQSIEIAKSIADKIAQNKLENRQQRVMENMYPAFNFTQEGIAYKNPLYMASFAPGMSNERGKGTLAPGYGYTYDENRNIIGTRKLKSDETGRNGAIVKAIKNL